MNRKYPSELEAFEPARLRLRSTRETGQEANIRHCEHIKCFGDSLSKEVAKEVAFTDRLPGGISYENFELREFFRSSQSSSSASRAGLIEELRPNAE